eukprot:TRINITY_DN1065_c4_g1_i1.p1 TRINITY_DN1065_c4_g1~~TRINITY_DN1065_c4_g1_i1.p1  ORF type:complete len:579 (+),score=250.26 TRINITY_DN1065_c4_g1_i1:1-1737(+)
MLYIFTWIIGFVIILSLINKFWNLYIVNKLVSKKFGCRPLGCFEYVMHGLTRVRGAFNICICLQIEGEFDPFIMRRALDIVQSRYAILQSWIDAESCTTPFFSIANTPSRIQFEINSLPKNDVKLGSAEYARLILESENNREFDSRHALCRLLLFQDNFSNLYTNVDEFQLANNIDSILKENKNYNQINETKVKSVICLTIRHEMIDGKSSYILLSKIMKEYSNQKRLLENLKSINNNSNSNSNSNKIINESENEIENENEIIPIPPAVENLIPFYIPEFVVFTVHLFRFIGLCKFFFARFISLPYSSDLWKAKLKKIKSKQLATNELYWQTSLQIVELSVKETEELLIACKKNQATLGCTLFAAAILAISEIIDESLKLNGKPFDLWAILVCDIRAQAVLRKALEPLAISNVISTYDFSYKINLKKMNFWKFAKDTNIELKRLSNNGYQLTSLVFARYLAFFSNWYSSNFQKPTPCPALHLSNLGNLDPIDQTNEIDNKLPVDIMSTLTRDIHNNCPPIASASVGVSSSTSWPYIQITSFTYKKQLRFTLTFPNETLAPEIVNRVGQRMCQILRQLN